VTIESPIHAVPHLRSRDRFRSALPPRSSSSLIGTGMASNFTQNKKNLSFIPVDASIRQRTVES